jgi:predicted nucleic acid-binding protein
MDVYDRLKRSAGFEIVHAAQKDFPAALDHFETYDGLSFVDATLAAYMHREEIEYVYSFDDDFDAIDGLTRLATADSPFR